MRRGSITGSTLVDIMLVLIILGLLLALLGKTGVGPLKSFFTITPGNVTSLAP